MNTQPPSSDSPTPDSADAQRRECDHLYTPAMLAEILGVSVRVVRRWYRCGLLIPTTRVMQLPYFDFSALTTGRRLARWMGQGATVQSIQRQVQLLSDRALGGQSPEQIGIEHLPITAEGKRLVLRCGDDFLEASGQLRFGFEAAAGSGECEVQPATLLFEEKARADSRSQGRRSVGLTSPLDAREILSFEEMIEEAVAAEDVEDLAAAIDWYRAALAAYGSNADVCFQLAELLYREGDLGGARERYFMALELEPELVEARANLGCVLAECNQPELAVAAFEGTLEQFADYADVHFHLARSLDDLGHVARAAEHWKKFLDLAPASPWAEEAQHRLSLLSPLLEF